MSKNKLGTMPVGKLLMTMSIPIMISMFSQALYNVIDSLYIARYSLDAFTALSLAFPIQQAMVAVSVGTNVGTNALLSYSLGQQNSKQANKIANTAVFLAIMNWLIFLCVGFFLARTIISYQTHNPEIIQYGADYLSLVTIFSLGAFGQMVFERLLLASGNSFYPMMTQIVGAIINIILDPIFIFGWFGIPEMGVKGAAIATVIGQVVAMILAFTFIKTKNEHIKFELSSIFKPELSIIKKIYKVGLPSIVMISLASVMVFFLNRILSSFSDIATAVVGAYFRLQSFAFMPVFGLNNGLVPIVSYNYGARNFERMKKAMKYAISIGFSVTLIAFLIFQLFTPTLLGLFDPTPEMSRIGHVALKTISYSFLFAGINIVCSSIFQSLQKGILSLFLAFSRQLLFLLPFAYLMATTGVLDNVWLAFPVAEGLTLILTLLILYRTIKKELTL